MSQHDIRRTVVLGVDGSATSEAAIAFALVLGSVGNAMVHRSPCSVAIVRPDSA